MSIPRYKISVDEIFSEDGEELGISQVAYTSTPAIITKGLAFNIERKMVFADELKYRLAAPAMIPDMPIYRFDDEIGEYEVVFTKEVIEKLRADFMAKKAPVQFNLEHDSIQSAPSYILDSWITGPSESDPSFTKYGITVPEGSWFIVSQFTDKEFFKNEILAKDRVGYSIEGFLGLSLSKISKYESYNDYPQAAIENAKTALRWAEENGWGDCGTPVGKARANQLANGESLSRETIARIAAFERHRQSSDRELGDGCGRLMWLAWGGDEGVAWAQNKLKQIDAEMTLEVYIMEPNPDENEEEFISRCIANEIKDGYPQDQAVAMCYSKWENKNYKQNKQMEKKKFTKETLEDGTSIFIDKKEVGGEVYVIDENGDKTPVFDGEHQLTNGEVIATVNGKITEIKPAAEAAASEMEETTVEETVDETVEEEMAEPAVQPVLDEAAILAIIQPKLDELYSVIAELKNAIEIEDETEVEMKKETFSLAEAFANLKKRNK